MSTEPDIPKTHEHCQFCGGVRPSAVDVVVMRDLLGPEAVGFAHSYCFNKAVQERDAVGV